MEIVVDAMGGDRAPSEIVKGAVLAVQAFGRPVTLVGKRVTVEAELAKHGSPAGLTVFDAPEVIEMSDHPARAVRTRRSSSIVVGLERVREMGGAFVSAGNSGATMAASLLYLGRIPGVARPALATVFPSRGGRVVLIDVGANADVKAEWLAQFGIMGSLYAQLVLGIESPRVGLLSIGEEETKGSQLTLAAFPLLAGSGVNFLGNVEGRDIPRGSVDVVVSDGFTGNVAIKLAEGVGETLMAVLRREMTARWHYRIAAAVLRPAFRQVAKLMDYAEYGGAPLLGVQGLAIVAHGRSDARAIKAAIRVAGEAIESNLTGAIAAGIGQLTGEDTAKEDE